MKVIYSRLGFRQGRINHVANVSIETGLPTKYTVYGPALFRGKFLLNNLWNVSSNNKELTLKSGNNQNSHQVILQETEILLGIISEFHWLVVRGKIGRAYQSIF